MLLPSEGLRGTQQFVSEGKKLLIEFLIVHRLNIKPPRMPVLNLPRPVEKSSEARRIRNHARRGIQQMARASPDCHVRRRSASHCN